MSITKETQQAITDEMLLRFLGQHPSKLESEIAAATGLHLNAVRDSVLRLHQRRVLVCGDGSEAEVRFCVRRRESRLDLAVE